IAYDARRLRARRRRVRALRRADADADRSRDVVQDDVGEGHPFEARAGTAVKLEGAAVHLVQYAVRDRDVLGHASPEAEHRPARAERRVGDRHELAAPEQRAGVVLRLDVAVVDRHELAADEVEAVVVAVDAVVDVKAVRVDVLALDHAHAVIRALPEAQIANAHVLAAVEQDVVRTAVAAESTRRGDAALRGVELESLSVD